MTHFFPYQGFKPSEISGRVRLGLESILMFWFCSTSISLGKCVKSATAQPDSTAFRREGSWDQSGTCGLFTVPLEGLVRASISFRLESANGILPALGLILANTLDLHVLFFFLEKESSLQKTRSTWNPRGSLWSCTFTLSSICPCSPSESVTPHSSLWLLTFPSFLWNILNVSISSSLKETNLLLIYCQKHVRVRVYEKPPLLGRCPVPCYCPSGSSVFPVFKR